jgi:hypothetical protein
MIKMGINIVYTSDDNKFKPFNLHFEPYISDNSNFNPSTLKLVNKDLGVEIFLESGDSEITINQKIQDDLNLSYKKIVDDFDDNKQIFRSLKKIKVNLEQLVNSS